MVQAKAGALPGHRAHQNHHHKKYRLAHFTFRCPQVSSSAFGFPGIFDSVRPPPLFFRFQQGLSLDSKQKSIYSTRNSQSTQNSQLAALHI